MIFEFITKFDEIISYKESDLVLLRHESDYGGYENSWWRVLFIDSDGTFIGCLEKYHWMRYTKHKKGDHIRFDCLNVLKVYQEGQEFCYNDDVTICSCIGLCREKY